MALIVNAFGRKAAAPHLSRNLNIGVRFKAAAFAKILNSKSSKKITLIVRIVFGFFRRLWGYAGGYRGFTGVGGYSRFRGY